MSEFHIAFSGDFVEQHGTAAIAMFDLDPFDAGYGMPGRGE